jgi:hypothetical protein
VSTTLAVVVRGTDGKAYPARRHTEAELDRIVHETHKSRCDLGLSVRGTVARLADLGIRRSVGAVARDLALYRCSRCAEPGTGQAPPDQ